jgi:hypothetical protein
MSFDFELDIIKAESYNENGFRHALRTQDQDITDLANAQAALPDVFMLGLIALGFGLFKSITSPIFQRLTNTEKSLNHFTICLTSFDPSSTSLVAPPWSI